jgi:hypothetical protein
VPHLELRILSVYDKANRTVELSAMITPELLWPDPLSSVRLV